MPKLWPFVLAVLVVGGLAGLAIAGRPTSGDPFVLDPAETQVVASSDPPSETSSTTATTVEPTTIAATTIAATTIVATTVAVTTTTTAPADTTIAGPLPRNRVRLVVANGDGRFQLAASTIERLNPLDYVIDLASDVPRVGATLIFYRAGFADEAAIVATDLAMPNATVAALPVGASQQPITDSDELGDVIIVLGPDAPR